MAFFSEDALKEATSVAKKKICTVQTLNCMCMPMRRRQCIEASGMENEIFGICEKEHAFSTRTAALQKIQAFQAVYQAAAIQNNWQLLLEAFEEGRGKKITRRV